MWLHAGQHGVPWYIRRHTSGCSNHEPRQQPSSYAQVASTVESCASNVIEFCQTFSRSQTLSLKLEMTDPIEWVPHIMTGSVLLCVSQCFRPASTKFQQPRKALISEMVNARSEGKRSYLVRDKLFVNNIENTPESG